MTLALIPIFLIILGITFPKFDKKNILGVYLKELALPLFVLCVSIFNFIDVFSHIVDNLLIAYIFIYIISLRSDDYSSYFNRSLLLLITFSLVAYGINTVWICFLLLSVLYVEINNKRLLNLLISAVILCLPNFDIVITLYGQWGGLLLVPAFIGLTVSKDDFIRLISGFLYLTIISNTKYTSLGYDYIVLIGIVLSLFLIQVERRKLKYTYTMALLPFIGVANPFHIIALYIFIETTFFIKCQTYEIVRRVETENGAIKNIKFQEIAFLIFSLVLAFSVPGSPLSWVLASAANKIGLIMMIVVMDLLIINQNVIEESKTISIKKDKFDIDIINNVLFFILLPILMYKEIFTYNLWGILFGFGNLTIILIFKKRIGWLYTIFNLVKGSYVNFGLKISDEVGKQENNLIHQRRNDRLMFSGVDEAIIWSLFILAISILLIGRYL